MPDPKLPAPRPVPKFATSPPAVERPPATVFAPDRLARAAEAANAERQRIHDEGHAKGFKLGERYRTLALIALGFIAGMGIGGLATASLFQSGMFSASAVADRVLQRTVDPEDPFAGLEHPPLSVQAEGEREGCAPGQRMQGGRRCPPEPPSAPQQQRN